MPTYTSMRAKQGGLSKIESILSICDVHAARLNLAVQNIGKYFPISSEVLKNLPKEDLPSFDMLTARHGKLQDMICSQLLGAILDLVEETKADSVIDKINRLAKLGLPIDVHEWSELRKLRNEISIQYPDDYAVLPETLNKLYASVPRLLEIYLALKNYANEALIKIQQ